MLSESPEQNTQAPLGVAGHDHGRPLRARDRPVRPAPSGADRPDGRHSDAVTPRRLKIAVVTGGRSSEHEIALASARSVKEALDPARYDVVTVEIGRDGTWALEAGRTRSTAPSAARRVGPPAETLPVPASSDGVMATLDEVDVVLPLLHGPFGEDGTVQGLLELAGIPYVGAGVLSSALAMDKDRFKVMMRGAGVPVTRSVTIHAGEPLEHPYDYPVFVKPARLGSSVGITQGAKRRGARSRPSSSPSATTRRS